MKQKKENKMDFSMEEAMRLAQSDTARQLMDLLRRQNGEALQKAADSASAGNYEQVKQIMSQLLSDPKAAELMQRLKE